MFLSAAILSVVIASPQQAETLTTPRYVTWFTNTLREQVGEELLRSKRLFDLSDDKARKIEDALEEPIKDLAAEFAKDGPQGLWIPEALVDELASRVAEQLGGLLGPNQRRQYEKDNALRRRLLMDATLDVSVVMIDHRVGLTAAQRKQVRSVLAAEWKTARFCRLIDLNDDLQPGPGHAKGAVPWGFPEAEVLAALTQTQRDAWQFHRQRVRDKEPRLQGAIHAPAAPTSVFSDILKHHAFVLTEQLELTATQQRKLVLLGKKAGQEAHAAQQEHVVLNEKYESPPTKAELRIWEVGYASDPELARCLTSWSKLVRGVLSEAQRAKFDQRKTEQVNAAHRAWAKRQAHLMCRWQIWTAKEAQGIYDIFLAGPVDSRGLIESTFHQHWWKLPDEKISNVLGEEGLDRLRDARKFHSSFHTNGPSQ